METVGCGKCLVLDGRMQSTEADDFIYHEALVHPAPLTTDSPPETALVIGGGEGACLRELLKYQSMQRVVMIDIDADVVQLCREYLPEMHAGAFDDPRTEIRHEDARGYLVRNHERFDVIVSDLPEPMEAGPASLLYTRDFYRVVRDRLAAGGLLTVQAGMAKHTEIGFFAAMHRTLQEVFTVVVAYQAFVPCFGTPLGFILAGDRIDPRHQNPATVDALIAQRVQGELRYWDGETHRHSFALPKHLRRAIDAETRVATDENPLVVSRPDTPRWGTPEAWGP